MIIAVYVVSALVAYALFAALIGKCMYFGMGPDADRPPRPRPVWIADGKPQPQEPRADPVLRQDRSHT